MIRDVLEAVRQPEHTGENRCPPCTVVNVLLAAALGALVSRRSKPAGAAVTAVSIGLIYLRGYLVPGTPELTKRYLPPSVLRWFGKEPDPGLAVGVDAEPAANGERRSGPTAGDDGGAATVPEDLETYFLEAGILEPRESDGDLQLTGAFEAEWIDAIDSVLESGVDTGAVVGAFGFEDGPAAFDLEEKGNGAYALQYGSESDEGRRRNAGTWPSYAALVADIAASRRLGSWLEDWDAYGPEAKGRLPGGFRMFLETCPTAEGGVELTEETVTSCCSSETVVAVVCEETGDRLFEHPLPD